MKNKYEVSNVLIASAIVAMITACNSMPVVQEFPDSANATEEAEKLTAEIQIARNEQAEVLSPHFFEQAEKALESARQDQIKMKDSREILHKIAIGRTYLNKGKESVQLVRSNMEEVVIARQLAMERGAQRLFESDFRKTDQYLKEVTSEIEKRELESISHQRVQLQAEYRDLEYRAIKEVRLGPAQKIISQALTEGAREFAPQTLALAEKKIADTSAFILANRHDLDQVKARSDDAMAAAEHLLKITQNAQSTRKASPEELALQLEKEEVKIQDDQSRLAQERNAALILASQVSALSKEKAVLEADHTFNQRIEQAQTQFSSQEAEVLKQGDKVLIRLKGLEFPKGKAVLKASSQSLLAKVQEAITGFGNGSVSVEGHTDSDGDKTRNEKLSTDRARAVADYLVMATPNPSDKARISFVGYGDQKPISSNRTAAGKAQNRRVDIIILPERNTSQKPF